MKCTAPVICITLFWLLHQLSTAQTVQDWKTTGNKLTGTGKIGSSSANDVGFISNNITRFQLKSNGTLRFNSDQTSIQFPNPGATPKPMMFIYESGSSNTKRMLFAYSPEFPTYGLQYSTGDNMDFVGSGTSVLNIGLGSKRVGIGAASATAKLHINSAAGEDALRVQVNSATRLLVANNGGIAVGESATPPINGLFVSGNTGIGTATPLSKLHVKAGSSGTTPFFLSTLSLESATHNYMNILAPNGSETGILFGHAANNISGGIIYNSFGTLNGLQFRTNGNITRAVITDLGKMSVGDASPGNFQLKILHNADFGGLGLENGFSHDQWGIHANAFGDLDLFHNGVFMGEFNKSTGAYTSLLNVSAKNMQPLEAVLNKISRLKPFSYRSKNAEDKNGYTGFAAEDVKEIFPDLVTHVINKKTNLAAYTFDYSGLSVIAIKGIQELSAANKALEKENTTVKAELEKLRSDVEALKAIVFKNDQGGTASRAMQRKALATASLKQNVPNPFSGTTNIQYTLPEKFTKAEIIITDLHGKMIKQVNIPSSAKGSFVFDAAGLPAGTFMYSLVLDGRMTSSKKMEHLK